MWPKRFTVLRVTNPALYPEESLRIQTACPSASYMGNAAFLATGSMEGETQENKKCRPSCKYWGEVSQVEKTSGKVQETKEDLTT